MCRCNTIIAFSLKFENDIVFIENVFVWRGPKLSDTCNNFEPPELTPEVSSYSFVPLRILDLNLFENSAMTRKREIQRDLEEKAKKASEANDNMKEKEEK